MLNTPKNKSEVQKLNEFSISSSEEQMKQLWRMTTGEFKNKDGWVNQDYQEQLEKKGNRQTEKRRIINTK